MPWVMNAGWRAAGGWDEPAFLTWLSPQ